VKEPVWLDRIDALAMHEMLLAQHERLDQYEENMRRAIWGE